MPTVQITPTGFIDPILVPPTLLIVGAGHVAIPLAQVVPMAGFQVIVTDDRAEYATSDRFPGADQVSSFGGGGFDSDGES